MGGESRRVHGNRAESGVRNATKWRDSSRPMERDSLALALTLDKLNVNVIFTGFIVFALIFDILC